MSHMRLAARYLGMALVVVGAIFFAVAVNIIWMFLEINYGPLFPEWFYDLINMQI